jgi:hypothetical protein
MQSPRFLLGRWLLGASSIASVALATAVSHGAPPEQSTPLPESDIREPSLLPAQTSSLAGHFSIFGAAALAVPFGRLSERFEQRDFGRTGYGFELDAAVGVSRTVALGAWGQAVLPSSRAGCSECSVRSVAFGPFVRYHLVQGVRFDPWASAGLGLRLSRVEGPDRSDSYTGIDWLRLQVGGDWYAVRSLAFGPFLELDLGTFFRRPEDAGSAAVAWHFLAGMRVGLDVPGR